MLRPSCLSGLKIDDQIKLEPKDMRTDNEIRLPLPPGTAFRQASGGDMAVRLRLRSHHGTDFMPTNSLDAVKRLDPPKVRLRSQGFMGISLVAVSRGRCRPASVSLGAHRQSQEWSERNDTVFDLVALR